MPLPKYLTQQPDISPTEAVARRMRRLGLTVTMERKGRTILLSGLESDDVGHETARRAIRIACEHADAERLTIETAVPLVESAIVSDYEVNGFRVVMETDEEHEQGAHCLLRRAAA